MDGNGKWLMLVEDEPFNREHNLVLEIQDDVVRCGDTEGSVVREGRKLFVNLSPSQRIVLTRPDDDADTMEGEIYEADLEPLPEGDPRALWDALDHADVDDERFDKLPVSDPVWLIRDELADAKFAGGPSKYSTIDVSMYSCAEQAASGLHAAETDDDVEAALCSLPLARVVLRSAPVDTDTTVLLRDREDVSRATTENVEPKLDIAALAECEHRNRAFIDEIGGLVFDALEARYGPQFHPAVAIALGEAIPSVLATIFRFPTPERRREAAAYFEDLIERKLQVIEEHRATIEAGLAREDDKPN